MFFLLPGCMKEANGWMEIFKWGLLPRQEGGVKDQQIQPITLHRGFLIVPTTPVYERLHISLAVKRW